MSKAKGRHNADMGYMGEKSEVGGKHMIFLVIVVVLLLFIIIGAVNQTKNENKANEEFEDELKQLNFIISKKVVAGDGILFVDDENKQWTIKTGKDSQIKIYKYSDLNEFEVYQDGESIAKGRAGSALAGGILFGPVGAIVGGSRSKKISNKCRVLQVRIRVNDLSNPERVVNCLSLAVKKDSTLYKNAFEAARNMAATLSYIQNQV